MKQLRELGWVMIALCVMVQRLGTVITFIIYWALAGSLEFVTFDELDFRVASTLKLFCIAMTVVAELSANWSKVLAYAAWLWFQV